MRTKFTTLKVALLSLALLAIMTGAPIAPILGEVAKEFPASSTTAVQMVLTLPSIFIMGVSILTGQLASRIPKRRILFIGLVIFTLGGVAGVYAPSITLLLITRSLLGIGVGMIAPLATSLIADFFTGEERAQMVGYSQSARTLIGILVGPVVGAIAAVNWRNVFWIYWLGAVVFVIAFFFIPEPPRETKTISGKTERLPRAVWLLALFMMLHRLAFFVVPTNLSVFVEENGWGNAALAGWAISAITLASFFASMFFAPVYKVIGRWLGMLSVLIMAAGMAALLFANGIVGLMLSMLLLGIGQGFLFPLLLFQTAQVCSGDNRTLAIALVSSTRFLAQFLVPYVFAGLGWVFNTNAIRGYLWIDLLILLLATLGGSLWLLRKPGVKAKSFA
ncbi:MAG: MFS transporter [Anaerolineae bacterium]|nr:MFS transporter [Anaerolineae bacterium]